jgi:hypothetical protein
VLPVRKELLDPWVRQAQMAQLDRKVKQVAKALRVKQVLQEQRDRLVHRER